MPESSVLDVIRRRRSVRRFQPRPVEPGLLTAVLEAARLAPSASNSQPWRLVVVRDRALVRKLAECVPFGVRQPNAWIAEAPCVIVACGQPHPLVHRAARLVSIDLLRVDVAIAVEHLVLVAAELGLGTCWVGWFHEGKVRRLLGIPRGVRVIAIVPLGYPAASALDRPATPRRTLAEIVSYDRFRGH